MILNVYEGIWKYKILLVRQSFVWVCELHAWKFRNLFKLYKNLLNWIVCGVLVFIVCKLAYLKKINWGDWKNYMFYGWNEKVRMAKVVMKLS